MQGQNEWTAAIGDVRKKRKDEREKVSRLKEAMENLEHGR
jgi:hypothetical protein